MVDATGVGAAVVDLLERARLGVRIVPVSITAGADAHEGMAGSWRVPKRDLVSVLQVLLQQGRLRVAQALAEAQARQGVAGFLGTEVMTRTGRANPVRGRTPRQPFPPSKRSRT